jgi:hypothetical protein
VRGLAFGLLTTAAVMLVAALAAPIAAQTHDGPSAIADSESVLAVIDAERGALTAKGDGQYRVTLGGVTPRSVWFSDRPARGAGTFPITDTLERFFGSGQEPPNAAIEIFEADDDRDVLVVEVSNPRYQRAKARLTFDAAVLDDTTGVLGTGLTTHAVRGDPRLPKRFDKVALFLDDSTGCSANYAGPAGEVGPIDSLNGLDCSAAQAVMAWTNDDLETPLDCDNYQPFDLDSLQGITNPEPLGVWGCQQQSERVLFQAASGNTSLPGASFVWTFPCAFTADHCDPPPSATPTTPPTAPDTTPTPAPPDPQSGTYQTCIKLGGSPDFCQREAQGAGG